MNSTIEVMVQGTEFGDNYNKQEMHFVIAGVVLCIFSPLTWIRKIQKLRFAFMFGVAMIFITVIAISAYCYKDIKDRNYELPPAGFYKVN